MKGSAMPMRYRLSLIGCLLMTLFLAPTIHAQTRSSFDLPAQPLAASLRAVASKTGTNVLFDPPLVEGRVAPALKAQITLDQAFTTLLADTGLTYKYLDEKTVTIISRESSGATDSRRSDQTASNPEANSDKEPGKNTSQDFHVAQVDQATAGPTVEKRKDEQSESKKPPGIEEIVVTGTHIPVQSSAPPTLVFTRDDIDRSGAGSVQQFLQTLPQNFNSTNEATNGGLAIAGAVNNVADSTSGAGVDLHGLGANSTLVLVNGGRLAPGNTAGNFTDISAIPLAAIERVEIVPDGASAIYGADAVGGVVNFIFRRDS